MLDRGLLGQQQPMCIHAAARHTGEAPHGENVRASPPSECLDFSARCDRGSPWNWQHTVSFSLKKQRPRLCENPIHPRRRYNPRKQQSIIV